MGLSLLLLSENSFLLFSAVVFLMTLLGIFLRLEVSLGGLQLPTQGV